MNTNIHIDALRGYRKQKASVNLHSLWIGVAAIGCAFLLETQEIDLTYPLEAFFKSVLTDNTIVEDHLYKIKL
ncbi:MAG: hypothetical protein LPK07_04920 [Hymenobacteraceae bacterium]|nr:hypothetical protein [Hymenobacteraceae bacterium]MDX5481004.1 hypothetical protein [Hymenobacteraceae bacterium]